MTRIPARIGGGVCLAVLLAGAVTAFARGR